MCCVHSRAGGGAQPPPACCVWDVLALARARCVCVRRCARGGGPGAIAAGSHDGARACVWDASAHRAARGAVPRGRNGRCGERVLVWLMLHAQCAYAALLLWWVSGTRVGIYPHQSMRRPYAAVAMHARASGIALRHASKRMHGAADVRGRRRASLVVVLCALARAPAGAVCCVCGRPRHRPCAVAAAATARGGAQLGGAKRGGAGSADASAACPHTTCRLLLLLLLTAAAVRGGGGGAHASALQVSFQ